jgi:Outer membrane protein beta-barrel domain
MRTLETLLCMAALAVAVEAQAQQPTTLMVPAPGQWDVAGQLALLNRNKSDLSRWDHWYSVAAIDGSAGRYWTPHLKTEFEIGTAGQGTIDGMEETPIPGQSFPYTRYRDHKLRETTVGATALYQFLENQWVHPFIGAGAELVRERHTAGALPAATLRLPTAAANVSVPAVAAIDTTRYSVRPLVVGGFKFYVSQRAFVRADVRTAFSTNQPVAWQWRGGIGFDF